MADYTYTISGTSSSAAGAANLASIDKQIRKAFGTDIFFDGNYSITAKGDYQLLEGLAALRQAIYYRLITKPGEYAFVPEYGVGITTYVKKKRDAENIDSLKNAIKANLLRDPRINGFKQIIVEYIPDGIQIVISLDINGRALRFKPFVFTGEG